MTNGRSHRRRPASPLHLIDTSPPPGLGGMDRSPPEHKNPQVMVASLLYPHMLLSSMVVVVLMNYAIRPNLAYGSWVATIIAYVTILVMPWLVALFFHTVHFVFNLCCPWPPFPRQPSDIVLVGLGHLRACFVNMWSWTLWWNRSIWFLGPTLVVHVLWLWRYYPTSKILHTL